MNEISAADLIQQLEIIIHTPITPIQEQSNNQQQSVSTIQQERDAEILREEEIRVTREPFEEEARVAEELEQARVARERLEEEERVARERLEEEARVARERLEEEERVARERLEEEERVARERLEEEERVAKELEEARVAKERLEEEERVAKELRKQQEAARLEKARQRKERKAEARRQKREQKAHLEKEAQTLRKQEEAHLKQREEERLEQAAHALLEQQKLEKARTAEDKKNLVSSSPKKPLHPQSSGSSKKQPSRPQPTNRNSSLSLPDSNLTPDDNIELVPIRSSTQQQGEIKLPSKGTIQHQGSQLAELMMQAQSMDEDYLHSQSYSSSTFSTQPTKHKDDARVAKKPREKASLPSTSSKGRSEQQHPLATGILEDQNMRELAEENRRLEEMLGGIDLTASTPSPQTSPVKKTKGRSEQSRLQPTGSLEQRRIMEQKEQDSNLFTEDIEEMLSGGARVTASTPLSQPSEVKIKFPPRGSIHPQGTAIGMRTIEEENTDELFLYQQATSSSSQSDTLALGPDSSTQPPTSNKWNSFKNLLGIK